MGRRLLAAATVLEHEFRGPQVGGLELLGRNYGGWTCVGFWTLAAHGHCCVSWVGLSMLPGEVGWPACMNPGAHHQLISPAAAPPRPTPAVPLQDVEGCFVGDNLYIVQTRPQP